MSSTSLETMWLHSLDHTGLLLLFLTATCATSYVLYQLFFHPLSSVPGPLLAKFSRIWIAKHSRDGDMNVTMIELHKKYGKLVRTAPNELSVADPAAIKTIYAAGSRFRKSDWYSVFQGHRVFDLFAGRDEKIHGQQRRLVSHAYSMEALLDLEQYVNKAIDVFLDQMDQRQGHDIDMGKWMQLFAFDVIGELTFSKRFGFMDAGKDDGSFQIIQDALRSAAWIGQMPSIYWAHDRLMPYIGNHLGITARNGSMRQFAVRSVESRKDKGTDHQDVLAKLLATQKAKPEEMNDEAIMSMASSNIFAGSDTTAISMRAILYYLLKNPGSKQRLIEEIDAKRRDGKLSDPARLSEANEMPYLQAVMYEALRLHPAVGMSLPRVVPDGGTQISGQHVPAGCIVGVNPWVIHRDEQIFGGDADAFRPERWLEGNNEDKHRFFFAFGSGSRMCMGRNISWMEMSKLIPTMFMHYDIELTHPDAQWTMNCWWFVSQHGLNVRLTPRQK